MNFRLMCLALLFVPLAGAESKTITVPMDYPTVKTAIDAAVPGDTVLIKPGQYQESLVIDKAITIKGEAPEQVLIHNSVLAGDVIKITSKDTVRLENLLVEHSDKEPDQENLKYPSLILVEEGKAEVRQCVMRKGAGCGLLVSKESLVLAENCRMEKNTQAGAAVNGQNARGRFVKCAISENSWGGISVFDEGTGEFIENTLTKNGRIGIYVFGPGPEGLLIQGNQVEEDENTGIQVDQRKGVCVESNRVSKNPDGGIRIQSGAQATVKLNICEDNRGPGIQVAGVLTQATLEQNTSIKNKGSGILVNAGAQARASGNTASDNSVNGIVLRNWNTTAEITGNTCAKNGTHGILVALGASAPVEGNTCSENGGHGIAATDEGTTATIGANTVEQNADQTPLMDIPMARQGQVERFYVGWALAAAQFDYLEQFVERLRTHKCRDLRGNWELDEFYDGLRNGYWHQTWRSREPFMASVKKWCEQKPQSVAARILMAEVYKNYAWEARGGGYADEVTPEGLKVFKENLAEAEKVLKEAELLAEKDPQLYAEWLEVGMGLNYKRDQEETLLEKGVALAPDYYPIYNNMATELTPRWHGKGRDLEDFFKKAWDSSKSVCGDTLYAMLVADNLREFNCIYAGSEEMAEWDGLDCGFQQLLKDFPGSNRYLNQYCLLACMFKKREVAADLFGRIGEKDDTDVWGEGKDSGFRKYRRWATMDDQPFPCRDERSTPFGVPPTMLKRYLLMGAAGLIGLSLLATLFIVVFFGGKAIKANRR